MEDDCRFEFQLVAGMPELQADAERFAGSLKKRKLNPASPVPTTPQPMPDDPKGAGLLKALRQREKVGSGTGTG